MLTERIVLDRIHAALDAAFTGADTASQAFARIEAFSDLSWADVGLSGVSLNQGAPA